MELAPVVEIQLRHHENELEVEYTVRNATAAPILVFDRMYDLDNQCMDPNWAYVEVLDGADGRAVVKRALELLPPGLQFENPPVPYAREVPVNGRASGCVRVPLPLVENSPYGHIIRRGQAREVPVDRLEFAVGWCPMPSAEELPPCAAPLDVEGETVRLLPYDQVAGLQRLCRSVIQSVKLKATVIR